MSDPELFSTWYLWLGVAAVIIVAAAALLISVWLAANRILKLAVAALGLVQHIKDNTQCVWHLEDTNNTAVNILNTANSIHGHGVEVAKVLHSANVTES